MKKKYRYNSIKRWPYIHNCYFSLECWCEMYLYGAPMRVHFKDKYWTVPGPIKWYSNRRHEIMWSGVVATTGPPTTTQPVSDDA